MESINSTPPSPWHEGEKAIQRSVGVSERMDSIGKRVIRDHLIEQHREFYPLLPFVVLGAVDPEGRPWATLRAGKPGFLHAADMKTLRVAVTRDFSDPAERGMEEGDGIGLLGIDPTNRRRNRLNGAIHRSANDGFDIAVMQSYGNCPQYIQLRAPAFTRDPSVPSKSPNTTMTTLDARGRAIIEQADTFFVASYVDHEVSGRQVDVSHRGGKSGFVRVGDDGVLTIPDFPGNLFFNTLGNFQLNPKAGLVFIDFASGDLLQLTGTVEILLDSPEIATFQGAERLWRFTPQQIIHRPAGLPLRLEFQPDGWSPNSLMTGSWEDSDRHSKALALAKAWRPLRVSKLVDESSLVRSITLEPVDNLGLIPQQPGQHLPIRLTLPGMSAPVLRTYTLSSAPSDDAYRLSVKKEGVASNYLHSLAVGDLIEARAPAGNFTINAADRRPVVLLAAGIGVTPMIAMLRYLIYEGFRLRRTRPTWLFYSAKTKAERAFDTEIEALVAEAKDAVQVVRLLSNTDGAIEHEDYDIVGRFDVQMLREILPFDDYDFFICGPTGFMQASYDGLRQLNIDDERIHAEAFGPASLTRTTRSTAAPIPGPPPSTEPVAVAFLSSGKEARWTPDTGSLLELAEARGVDAPFSCRGGSCGSCATRIVEGAVAYTQLPSFKVSADQALICCSVPAAAANSAALRLHLDL
ncbi:2Fe-2S iron-sulfur cluster-binding protein [Stenotrophobium rhamnosiphilum]|uniref:FAD-binding oxidoreductase n=1 Tax=Stenotrophobium rhamnosiphilum TaxID=2029166 RepID=A0A2T5ME86_9GAMM|nr:pyridoxamine 5'-phosphate oxidase family protein [Stenotrophobium rhamnosiphilum]PTU30888.1 FAD-binding oxidoreductase [Stenotrophobium rhamnosiphilum]